MIDARSVGKKALRLIESISDPSGYSKYGAGSA
jgi:hypothetical protein